MEFTEGMLDRYDCLPVIGLSIGKMPPAERLANGMIFVEKSPSFDISVSSRVASFSGTIRTISPSEIAEKPLT